jgi:hypothetical protein
MTIQKPQAKTATRKDSYMDTVRDVKAPGSSTPQVVEPGVTYAFNIILDKVGSTAVAQFHLPLNMSVETMQAYTKKALEVIEMQQLRFDAQKLKVEIKLSAVMLDQIKQEFEEVRSKNEKEARLSGNGKVAKPLNQQLVAMDNNYRQSQRRHDAMIADLAQMEKKLGTVSSNPN